MDHHNNEKRRRQNELQKINSSSNILLSSLYAIDVRHLVALQQQSTFSLLVPLGQPTLLLTIMTSEESSLSSSVALNEYKDRKECTIVLIAQV